MKKENKGKGVGDKLFLREGIALTLLLSLFISLLLSTYLHSPKKKASYFNEEKNDPRFFTSRDPSK